MPLPEAIRAGRAFESQMIAVMLPRKIAGALNLFLVDRKSGNVHIHVKDGEVLGAHVEEVVTAKYG